MKIQPRQLLLDLWQAAAAYSYVKGEWVFGGRAEPNSTADAEQLLCLMYPATTESPYFRLEQPDLTARDVTEALRPLGEAVDVPQVLLGAVSAFLRRYRDDDGIPVFHGGSYLQAINRDDELPPDRQQVEIVDSMSMSITLCLAILGFFKEYRNTGIRRPQLLRDIEWVEKAASERLTAAMVGLLRSFAVHAFSPTSAAGDTLLRTTDQDRLPREQLTAQLQRSLNDIRADLQRATAGTADLEVLENENHLFECGWSWGVVRAAPTVRTDEFPEANQKPGRAISRPNLYFTLTALDGIADLFSERTRRLGLLTAAQQALSDNLQFRWDLVQRYWSTIAGFGSQRTALEDIPWRPTVRADGEIPVNDHYYSLQVAGMMIEDLYRQKPSDNELSRVAKVLDELAIRSRVTRRATRQEAAIDMHVPGLRVRLVETDDREPELVWPVADFVTALLKRTVRLATLARGAELRQELLDLADRIWDHIEQRMIEEGPGEGLWDDPRRTFRDLPPVSTEPSWYFTERVMECLIAVVGAIEREPVTSGRAITEALELLAEAEHLFHKQLLSGGLDAGPAMRRELDGIGVQIERGRAAAQRRPGTAKAILQEILLRLDQLDAARPQFYEAIQP